MFQFIKGLHGRPENEKRRFAFGGAVFVTLSIALLWLFFTVISTDKDDLDQDISGSETASSSFTQLFDFVQSATVELRDGVKTTVKGVADLFEQTATTTLPVLPVEPK